MTALIPLVQLLSAATLMQAPDLSFAPGADGQFAFDTGVLKGRLSATAKEQGLTSVVDVKTGRELTKGRNEYGIFTYYRFLGSDRRWGTMGWVMPKTAERTSDGAVRVTWSANPEQPFELIATYKWARPNAIDVETAVKVEKDLPQFEVFIGSYFADTSRCSVYLKPGRHTRGEPELAAADVCPLTRGVYYAFVRDLAAARMIFDGRWLLGDHPVDWSITRHLAGALAVQEDRRSGPACVLMSRPEDCPVVYASYNMDPPDGVASHHSTYLGLFGKDIRAGQTVRTTSRLVVLEKVAVEQVISEYRKFCAGN